jgi:hypothetical protein
MADTVQPDASTEAARDAAVVNEIAAGIRTAAGERNRWVGPVAAHAYAVAAFNAARLAAAADYAPGIRQARAESAAAERERCVAVVLGEVGRFAGDDDLLRYARLVLRSVARKLDPVTPEQAARALEAHHAAAIARAGTSGVDRG